MARSLKTASDRRVNNRTSHNSFSETNISMSGLRDWYNARFYKQANDSTPGDGNAALGSGAVSLGGGLSNKSWLSIQIGAASESYTRYQTNADGRLRLAFYNNADVSAKYKFTINGSTWGGSGTAQGTWINATGINVYSREQLTQYTTSGSGVDKAVTILFSWNGGSTYNTISGLTARISYGSANCYWKKGGGSWMSIGGSGASLSGGYWDHLSYN